MKRGKIVITKNEGKVSIESVEGLWNGKDRTTISTHLRKAMRRAKADILKAHKQADLEKQKIEGLRDDVVVSEKVANKNIIEEKKQCPKTTKKKKLLMKAPKK